MSVRRQASRVFAVLAGVVALVASLVAAVPAVAETLVSSATPSGGVQLGVVPAGGAGALCLCEIW